MDSDKPASPPDTLLTLDSIRAEHGRLLEESIRLSEQNMEAIPDRADYDRRVRRFVFELVQRGAYYDEPLERLAMQAYLDHWTRDLCERVPAEERQSLARLEVGPYNKAALRELQDRFKNPFDSLAREWGALAAETKSPIGILKLLEDKARTAGLRFQDGLLRQIAAQVTNDAEGPTLAEFCLWHLFEDPDTRTGNKIRHPRGEVGLSCTGYLREKAAALYHAQAEPQRVLLLNTLARFEKRDDAGHRYLSGMRLPGDTVGPFQLYRQANLSLESFLFRSRLAFKRRDKLTLVHQSLRRQWVELAVEITRRRERDRLLRWGALVLAVVAAIGFGAWLGVRVLDRYWTELAMGETSASFNQGGAARSIVRRYQDAYDRSWYTSDEQYRQMTGQAIFQAGYQYHVEQIEHSLHALHAADTSYVRNVVNDALGAAIGYLARAGALGSLPAYPTKPEQCGSYSKEACVRLGSWSYSLPVPQQAMDAGLVNADYDGKQLAAAWKDATGVRLAVFAVPPADPDSSGRAGAKLVASKIFRLDRMQCRTMSQAPRIRFSPDGRIVTLECLDDPAALKDVEPPGTDAGVEWSHTEIDSGALSGRVKDALAFLQYQTREIMERRAGPEDTLKCRLRVGHAVSDELLRLDQVDSVYFERPARNLAVNAFVSTGPDGYVRLWHDDAPIGQKAGSNNPGPPARCPRAQFFSDFVRVSLEGRPTALAFQETGPVNYYAIYHGDPPVIRVFEQHDPRHAELVMEHYPAAGLGRIVDMRFTETGHCIEVRMARARPLTRTKPPPDVHLKYDLILDHDVLVAVGEALLEDLKQLSKLSMTEAQAAVHPYQYVSAYKKALERYCGTTTPSPS